MEKIVLDFNGITRSEVLDWRESRSKAKAAEKDKLDFDMFTSLVIASWEYGEVDYETYQDLGYEESLAIDAYVSSQFEAIHKKK